MGSDNLREAARELGRKGARKGGEARAKTLTAEDRREISRLAAEKRWAAEIPEGRLPRETHTGVLKIGDRQIPCSVLENGTRVFSTRGINRAMGLGTGGGPTKPKDGAPQLPRFLGSKSLEPFISNDLRARLISPLQYRPKHGGRTAYGYEANLLPTICGIILDAQKAGALKESQSRLVETADILLRGFAHVGIIALVDEATGYQAERARDELNRILEAYISKELLTWTKRFPDEFFKQIYRLHGWQYKEGHHKRPRYVGRLVKNLVYKQLPPGVLVELERLNPPAPKGYRLYKHHQFLTEDTGHPHLNKQIIEVTTLMRISNNKREFATLFGRAFPSQREIGKQLALNMPEEKEPIDNA